MKYVNAHILERYRFVDVFTHPEKISPVYIVWEAEGYHAHNFQIGDIPHTTDVKDRYTGEYLECRENNSSCGVRPFEKGSITYEFLWKVLGFEEWKWDRMTWEWGYVRRGIEQEMLEAGYTQERINKDNRTREKVTQFDWRTFDNCGMPQRKGTGL